MLGLSANFTIRRQQLTMTGQKFSMPGTSANHSSEAFGRNNVGKGV